MKRICFVIISSLVAGGCATVTRGTTDQIQIVSEPAGAIAKTSLGHQCSTPCTLSVSRKDEFTVSYEKPGYENASIAVKTQIAGSGAAGFAGNIIAGGVVGMGVDAATGATLEHVPNPVAITLQPVITAKPVKNDTKKGKKAKAPQPQTEDATQNEPAT